MTIKSITIATLLIMHPVSVSAEPEPMMTKGDLCAYLSLSARQQTGFLTWATNQLKEDWSSDPHYLEALKIEIEIAEKKQTHYQSLFEFSKCHSDARWNERLIPDPI